MVPSNRNFALHNVQKKHKVTYDSSMMTGFIIHKADGTNHSDVKQEVMHILVKTSDSCLSSKRFPSPTKMKNGNS